MTVSAVALDVMSGDKGPKPCILAALQAVKRYDDLHIVLVGHQRVIQSVLKNYTSTHGSLFHRLTIEHADHVTDMSAPPLQIIRSGQESSLWKAVQLVQQKKVCACVSAGNTGAYIAAGRYLLGMLPHIERPAIISQMPGMNRCAFMLDLGANTTCSDYQLYQFAVLGSVYLAEVHGIRHPSIGLLNIGRELNKGKQMIKNAYSLIKKNPNLNFSRYVEGHELCTGVVDLIVCDGFSGNVALKSIEGTARYIRRALVANKKRLIEKILFYMAMPWLRYRLTKLDPGLYNGAALLGLQGILIKSHGAARTEHLLCAIEQARKEIKHNTLKHITANISTAFLAEN